MTLSLKVERYFLFVIVLVAAWLSFSYLTSESLWPDEALYAWSARQIAHNPAAVFSKDVIERQPPLFPILLSLVSVFSENEILFRGQVWLIGLACVFLMFYLGKVLGGNRFIGVVVAMGVAYNYLFQLLSARILSDNLQVMFFIILAIVLNRISESSSWFDHSLVGLCAVLAVLTKWSGAFSLVLIVAYYFLYLRRTRRWVICPLGIVMITIAVLLCINRVQLGSWLPFASAVQGGGKLSDPWWTDITFFHELIYLPFFWFFFLVGLIGLWKGTYSKKAFLAVWFFSTFLAISLSREKDARYILLALPAALLFYAIAVDYLVKTCLPSVLWQSRVRVSILILFFIVCLGRTLYAQTEIAAFYTMYTGFKEVAQEIQPISQDRLLVLSQSTRTFRYFTGFNYAHSGGVLAVLPKTLEELKSYVDQQNNSILLLIDSWEPYQPEWAFPPGDEKFRKIENIGFKLVKKIRRRWYSLDRQKFIMSTVIWLYEYKRNDTARL